uniref:Ephrin RBD domain-containing protein n=1 Tax=Denticeps clupeoides TaxID=299321 RepID=A0AAY4ALC1_9TELE
MSCPLTTPPLPVIFFFLCPPQHTSTLSIMCVWVCKPLTVSVLVSGDLSIEVNLNDYLDIFCPHYPADQPLQAPPETLSLYLSKVDFQGCVETKEAIMRWECNSPRAPYGPVRFSEKIQRFTPFSLGFEFLPGHHYYYTSFPTDDGPPLPCMKLRITVCCEAGNPPAIRPSSPYQPGHSTRTPSHTPLPQAKISTLINSRGTVWKESLYSPCSF